MFDYPRSCLLVPGAMDGETNGDLSIKRRAATMQRVAKAAARKAAKAAARKAAIAKSKAGHWQSARNKSKHATPEEAAIEQLRIAKGVKAVMAVNAAARKAANAKGMATKKGGKGVVRGALTVMLMTAGCVNAAKHEDAAAEQLRVEHEEFAVEEQRIGKAIEADEGAYRPRIQERNAKAIEKAAEKKAKEQEFLKVHSLGSARPASTAAARRCGPGRQTCAAGAASTSSMLTATRPWTTPTWTSSRGPATASSPGRSMGGWPWPPRAFTPPRRWGAWGGTSRPMGTWRSDTYLLPETYLFCPPRT